MKALVWFTINFIGYKLSLQQNKKFVVQQRYFVVQQR